MIIRCKLIFCVSYLFLSIFGSTVAIRCGYSACPRIDAKSLNIHIIPYSHIDLGWLKTVSEYYNGSRFYTKQPTVVQIYNSVIEALSLNEERRFFYVETAFFWMWWQNLDLEAKNLVRYLVENGQLEFVGGGWAVNDEATAHYQSIIDQYTWGFRILNDTLGICSLPRIAWQVDTFGHSRVQTSLFALFGFDAIFIDNIDYRDEQKRREHLNLEFIWQGSQSIGEQSRVFTSILSDGFSSPHHTCTMDACDDVILFDQRFSYEKLMELIVEKSISYKTNHIAIPIGGHFHYSDAVKYFKEIDKLIFSLRRIEPSIKVFYSSPSCYIKAVNDANINWRIKKDDFMPYASGPHKYFSGFFTSRPTFKRFERLGNNVLQVTKQLSALAFMNSFSKTSDLNMLRSVMGIMQHHDAIGGTAKQRVANDYSFMLHNAIESSLKLANRSLRKWSGKKMMQFHSCLLLNISQCEHSENNNIFMITIYNPLSWYVDHFVRVPVTKQDLVVFDSEGYRIDSQIIPIFDLIMSLPGRDSAATHELVFKAEKVPPLGYKMYLILNSPIAENYKKFNKVEVNDIDIIFNNKKQVSGIFFKKHFIIIQNHFFQYKSAVDAEGNSGAYIFRPAQQKAIKIENKSPAKIFDGPIVKELHMNYNDRIGQVIRIYFDPFRIEYKWVVGPIPVEERNKIGKEIITRYRIVYNNDHESCRKEANPDYFYTDSNGREMLLRIRNRRHTFNLTQEEPVAQNYFPITSKISLKNKHDNVQIGILTDRPQGGASLDDNEIELMIHRRILEDDGIGLNEALDEMAFNVGLVATGTHYLNVGYLNHTAGPNAEVVEKQRAQEIHLAPWLFFSPLTEDISLKIMKKKKPALEKSALKKSLPKNVQILTLEPWRDNKILLRLEHILEKYDDALYSKPIVINLSDLFAAFRVKSIHEMSLGANQLKSEENKLKWEENVLFFEHPWNTNNDFINNKIEIVLKPMEIKTFIVDI